MRPLVSVSVYSVCLRPCEKKSQGTGLMEPNFPPPCNWPPAHASLAHTCARTRTHIPAQYVSMLTENITKLCSRCSPAHHHSANDRNAVCVCVSECLNESVYVTMHVFVCSRVTSAPSPSLFAVTWRLLSCWTRLHKMHAAFWLSKYAACLRVCVCVRAG